MAIHLTTTAVFWNLPSQFTNLPYFSFVSLTVPPQIRPTSKFLAGGAHSWALRRKPAKPPRSYDMSDADPEMGPSYRLDVEDDPFLDSRMG